jgi:MerR family transcriptional regulator, redox-sensitive transcriptional activator SoxR
MSSDEFSIGELARRTAKRPSAIRYYEELGLLPPAARISGRRRYSIEAVRTLTAIDTAQRAGLSLDEIRTLLEAQDHEAAVDELRRIAERKLPELDAMIARATLVRQWLEAAARCECPSLDECCLFEPEQSPPAVTGRSRFDRKAST